MKDHGENTQQEHTRIRPPHLCKTNMPDSCNYLSGSTPLLSASASLKKLLKSMLSISFPLTFSSSISLCASDAFCLSSAACKCSLAPRLILYRARVSWLLSQDFTGTQRISHDVHDDMQQMPSANKELRNMRLHGGGQEGLKCICF